MKKIEIETTFDEHDCETCGNSWAEGGTVKIDGKEVLTIEPFAHCYGGTDYDERDLLILALHEVGINVLVNGEKMFISNHNEKYHGKIED